MSISNIKEKDVIMSSNSEIISVTTESNYDGQVTDIDDVNEQGVIQITMEEPVIVLPNQFGKNYHTTTIQLISVLGECKLLTDYDNYQRNVERYPGKEMYLDELRKIIAQLEVKLKLKADCLKKEILDIQEKKIKSSYVIIPLLSTDGPDKLHLDNLMDKLKSIALLKQIFYARK